MLPFILGSSLLIVLFFHAGIAWRRKEWSVIPLCVLVAVSAGFQVSKAKEFKNVWLQQVQFYWQLNWRIPALQPGTVLFTYAFPSNNDFYSGNALSAQLNWTYSDRVDNRTVQFQYILQDSTLGDKLDPLTKNVPVDIKFRTYFFEGNTNNSMYILPPSPGCLRVLDATVTPPEAVIYKFDLVPYSPIRREILAAIGLSRLDLVLVPGATPNHPPTQILGREIPHTWCYFFEKAELARQWGDYAGAISLLDEATAKGFTPLVNTEWYPFIESYARMGNGQSAAEITRKLASAADPTVQTGLCHLWQRLATQPGLTDLSTQMLSSVLSCPK